MQVPSILIHFKGKSFLPFVAVILALTIATPALADYLGPDRTVTETTSTCKVVLMECMYVPSKGDWRYKKVDDWSCSNESKPWQAYSDTPSSQGCFSATEGDNYWAKEEVLQEITVTHPPATISSSLQNCNLNNGWCNTSTELVLNGIEPLTGFNILAIEGSLNGKIFACSGSSCNVPLTEGDNNFTFWAPSSWGDSSEMGTFTSKVDTVPPTLGLDITASIGTNNWYTSPTFLSAFGFDSTSGLQSVLLSVDSGTWVPSTTLNEGVYNVAVEAQDYAGNISNTSTTISVDTTTPAIDLSLSGTSGRNGWYISNMQVTASACDITSGVGTFEVSADGSAYANYNSPITFTDGTHTIKFKATDNAGNETETPVQEFFIDTFAPAVALPTSWKVNDTIEYSVQDDGSGLSELRIVIEDEDEKYAKIVIIEKVSGSKFKDEITWDGKFKDGTTASPGEYLVWIKVSDQAGNETFALGIVTVPSPFSLFQSLPAANPSTTSPTPPKELFDEEGIPSSTTSTPMTTFGSSTSQPKETESKSLTISAIATGAVATVNSNTNVLWGTTAAALIGAATAYALGEQRKRKEEEARQRAQVQAEVDAKNAALEAERQAKWQAEKVQGWLEGQAILNAQIEQAKALGATDDEIAALKKVGAEKGFGAALGSASILKQNLYNTLLIQERTAHMEAKMAQVEAEEDKRWADAQQRKVEEKQYEQEMNLLACTSDNKWGIPRNNPNTQTALDWLISLYDNNNLPGNTALDRSRYILNATSSGPKFYEFFRNLGYETFLLPHIHFNNNIAPGDSGYDPRYQDAAIWPSSGNQDGHFLTALDFSLWANNQDLPLRLQRFNRRIALASVIGHEIVGDGTFGGLTDIVQTGIGLWANAITFGTVNKWFLSGEDKNFEKIINLGNPGLFEVNRGGNSIEDLRTTYQGWVAGEQITNGNIQTPQELSQWLIDNLK